MFRRILDLAITLVIVVALLAGPAYGGLRQGYEQAVRAYNNHNLYYNAEFFLDL